MVCKHEYMNISPPPPIIELATALVLLLKVVKYYLNKFWRFKKSLKKTAYYTKYFVWKLHWSINRGLDLGSIFPPFSIFFMFLFSLNEETDISNTPWKVLFYHLKTP